MGLTPKTVDLPTVDPPERPLKPQIKTIVLEKDGEYIVGYRVADALKLYEYLVQTEAFMDKVEYRIRVLNELLRRQGGKQ